MHLKVFYQSLVYDWEFILISSDLFNDVSSIFNLGVEGSN